jgi:hypothetical protein
MHPILATQYVDWNSMWKILVIGVLGGAGLTGVFSFGLVALNAAEEHRATHGGRRSPVFVGLGCLCFAVVLAGVGFGIDTMLSK